jgi:Rrf2 family transcriptional regulator, cysteine metabolism repressor
MNISVKGEYAIHAILDLAMQKPTVPVRIAAIAKRQRIPQKFLELILATLKQGGFVESRRGAEGGYLLARPARDITVGQVLRFIEGGKARAYSTRRKGDHPFAEVWQRMDQAMSAVVDESNFADLARRWREKSERYIPDWEI